MNVLTLAWMSLLELWRRRLAFLPLAVAVLMGLLLAAGIEINGRQLAADVLEASLPWMLATQLLPLAGELIGVLAGAGALADEVERGTVLLLVTKVPRWQMVLGKAMGVYVFVLLSFVAWTFVLEAGWLAHGGARDAGQLALAAILGVLPGILAATLSMAISARVTAQAAIVGSIVAFMVRGLAAATVAAEALGDHPVWQACAKTIEWLFPTDRLAQVGATVALMKPLDQPETLALLAPIGWLLLAIAIFSRRDMAH